MSKSRKAMLREALKNTEATILLLDMALDIENLPLHKAEATLARALFLVQEVISNDAKERS